MATLKIRQVSLQSWITSSYIATPFSVTSPGCGALSQSIKFYVARLTCLLTVSQTDHGNIVPVILRNTGWAKSVTTANTPSRCVERRCHVPSSRSKAMARNDDDVDDGVGFGIVKVGMLCNKTRLF